MFFKVKDVVVHNVVVSGVLVHNLMCVFECDDISDLPSMNQTDYTIMIGSKAHIISNNSWYQMQSGGNWVLQEAGTSAYTKDEVDAIIESLDAPTVGGSGKYISEIYETDGVIHASQATIQTSVNTSNNAVSSNAVKNYVDDSILALDATSVGGSGKYISEIYEQDGIIYPTPATIQTSVNTSTNAVSSNAVKTYVDNAETNAKADWFLLGTQISAATLHANDLNNYKTPGHYYIASNTTAGNVDNTPVNYAGKLNVELISNAENYIRQTYFANTDSTALISVRRYKGVDSETQQDIWSEWVTFPTPANVIGMIFGTTNATIIPAAGVNLDTLTTQGVWISGSTTGAQASSGRPDYANAGSKIFRLEVKALSSTRPIQEMYVYRIGTSEGEFAKYQRMSKTNGTWNDWQQVNATDVGTYYPPAQQSISPQVMSVNLVNQINEVDEVTDEGIDDVER